MFEALFLTKVVFVGFVALLAILCLVFLLILGMELLVGYFTNYIEDNTININSKEDKNNVI